MINHDLTPAFDMRKRDVKATKIYTNLIFKHVTNALEAFRRTQKEI